MDTLPPGRVAEAYWMEKCREAEAQAAEMRAALEAVLRDQKVSPPGSLFHATRKQIEAAVSSDAGKAMLKHLRWSEKIVQEAGEQAGLDLGVSSRALVVGAVRIHLEKAKGAIEALVMLCEEPLEDWIYDIRERELQGWEGPRVKRWGEACKKARAVLGSASDLRR